jgi:hypothetical protein
LEFVVNLETFGSAENDRQGMKDLLVRREVHSLSRNEWSKGIEAK